jgi:hypothetical protein
MRFCRADQVATFFFLTTAVALSFRPFSTTQADNRQTLPDPPERRKHSRNCPAFGCPLTPHDVHYNDATVKDALENIRSLRRVDANAHMLETLEQAASPDASAVTLTLIGYKGGQLQEQINQDRAVVVSPYFISEEGRSGKGLDQERILVGVFDGHAPLGEK